MNPGIIWELVRPTYFLPALKKSVITKKCGHRRAPPEAGAGGYLEEEGCRDSLLPRGGGGPGEAKRSPPRGFLAVYVGPEMRRFVIPASYLCQPAFRALMERAAEEFGFEQEGGLQIPCDEATFEELLRRAAALDRAGRRKMKASATR